MKRAIPLIPRKPVKPAAWLSPPWLLVYGIAAAILAGIIVNLPDAVEATANVLRFA